MKHYASKITSLAIVASVLFPSLAAAAPMHVNTYERKTALVDHWKRNQAWVEGRVKLVQSDKDTGEFFQASYEKNITAIREHVKAYDCANKINVAACRTSAK